MDVLVDLDLHWWHLLTLSSIDTILLQGRTVYIQISQHVHAV
jgi:hypothetical protein